LYFHLKTELKIYMLAILTSCYLTGIDWQLIKEHYTAT